MNLSICILDDDPEICDLLRILLETRDYRVVCASDGEEGLRKILDVQPDLIVLDLKMPGLNGYEVLHAVRSTPTVAHTPVVIVTSLTQGSATADSQWKERVGVSDFISKPFEPMDLVRRIEAILHPPVSHP